MASEHQNMQYDNMDNDQARAAWEALKPEPGSIPAHHMESAKATVDQHGTPTDQPDYYLSLLVEMDEYETERKEHNNDVTYLAWCEETFGPFMH